MPRSCVNCRHNQHNKTIVISSIKIRAIVFYSKTPVGCNLQPEGGTAAAVGGTVWSHHPKAGPFDYCFLCVQGRLIELAWLQLFNLEGFYRDHYTLNLPHHLRQVSKEEVRCRLLRSGLHPHPGPGSSDDMVPDPRFSEGIHNEGTTFSSSFSHSYENLPG